MSPNPLILSKLTSGPSRPWVASTWLKNDTLGKLFAAASGSVFAPEFNSSWSVTALVKFVDVAAGKNLVFSKTKESAPYSGQELQITSAGNIEFYFSSSQGTNWIRARALSAGIVSGTTYRITVTMDGSATIAGCKIYVNNVSKAITTGADSLSGTTINTKAFSIGSDNWQGAWNNGYIKDLAWWNVKLTDAQETALTTGSIDLSTHSASAYLQNFWRFQSTGISNPDTHLVVYDRKGSDNLAGSFFIAGDYVAYP